MRNDYTSTELVSLVIASNSSVLANSIICNGTPVKNLFFDNFSGKD